MITVGVIGLYPKVVVCIWASINVKSRITPDDVDTGVYSDMDEGTGG
jgi:hypothetical protein